MTSEFQEVDQSINFFKRHEQACAFIDRDENSSGNTESSDKSSDCESQLNKSINNEINYISESFRNVEHLKTLDKNGCDESYICSGSEEIESPAKSAESEDDNDWMYGNRVRITKPNTKWQTIELKEMDKSYRDKYIYDEIHNAASDSSDSSIGPFNHSKSSNNNNSKSSNDSLLNKVGVGSNCHNRNILQTDSLNKSTNNASFPQKNGANKINLPFSLPSQNLPGDGNYIMPAYARDKFYTSKSHSGTDSYSPHPDTSELKQNAKKCKSRKVKDSPVIDTSPNPVPSQINSNRPQIYPDRGVPSAIPRSKSASLKNGGKKGRQNFKEYQAKSIENNRGSEPVETLLQYINGTESLSSNQKKRDSRLNGFHETSERSKIKSTVGKQIIKSKKIPPSSKSYDALYENAESIASDSLSGTITPSEKSSDNSSVPLLNGHSNNSHYNSNPSQFENRESGDKAKQQHNHSSPEIESKPDELDDKLLTGEYVFTDYSQLATQDPPPGDSFVPVLRKKERRRQQQLQQKQVVEQSHSSHHGNSNKGSRPHSQYKVYSATKSNTSISDTKNMLSTTSTSHVNYPQCKQNSRTSSVASRVQPDVDCNSSTNSVSVSEFPPLNDKISPSTEKTSVKHTSIVSAPKPVEKPDSIQTSCNSKIIIPDHQFYSSKLKHHSPDINADNEDENLKRTEFNQERSLSTNESLTPSKYTKLMNEHLQEGSIIAHKVVAYGPLRDYMFKLWTTFQSELDKANNVHNISC